MKTILMIFLLFSPFSVINAENAITYTLSAGSSFAPSHVLGDNPESQMLAAGIRYYETPNWFYAANLTSWNAGNADEFSKSGSIITANIGYRTSNTLFFEGSLGIGYLNNPDGEIVYNGGVETSRGYLTKHRQFEVNAGAGYKFNNDLTLLFGWTHFSNCLELCNLDSSYKPNIGRNFLRITMEKRF